MILHCEPLSPAGASPSRSRVCSPPTPPRSPQTELCFLVNQSQLSTPPSSRAKNTTRGVQAARDAGHGLAHDGQLQGSSQPLIGQRVPDSSSDLQQPRPTVVTWMRAPEWGAYQHLHGSSGRSRVEGGETHVAADGALCGDLIHSSSWVGPLSGLHRRASDEFVSLLLGVGREVLVEALLHVLDGLHRHLHGIDSLMRKPGMEKLALSLQLPWNHPSGAQAWMLVSRVHPEDRAGLEVSDHSSLDQLIDANSLHLGVFLVGNHHRSHVDIEPWLVDADLLEELGHQSDMAQTSLSPSTMSSYGLKSHSSGLAGTTSR
eukprot:751711-Hanusia_phi.AAC.2